jgi:NAD-dependent deacetylase
MPENEMRLAMEATLQADVFVSIGSSLVVEPAASFPRLAREAGARLVILNNQETSLDELADLVIRTPIGETMRKLLSQLPG